MSIVSFFQCQDTLALALGITGAHEKYCFANTANTGQAELTGSEAKHIALRRKIDKYINKQFFKGQDTLALALTGHEKH